MNMKNKGFGLVLTLLACAASAADFSSWQKTMQIGFSGYNPPGGATPLTNFPALVVLSTNISGFGYGDFLSLTNQDLRFTAADQTTELNYEIESWNTNGASHVWVQVPLLADTNTVIHAYWGKSGTNAPACTTNGATWDAGYRAVWHLADAADNTQATDSTANRRTATNGTSLNATGKVGDGQEFTNAAASAFTVGSGLGDLSVTGTTLSAWVNLRNNRNYPMVLTYGDGTQFRFIGTQERLEIVASSAILLQADAGDAITENAWHHIATTFDDLANTVRLFVDGRLVKAGTSTLHFPSSGTNHIGRSSDGSYYFDGFMDEVRVSSLPRSTNWIWACYQNMASNSVFAGSFNTYGSVQSNDGNLPRVQNVRSQNRTDTSAETVGFLTRNGASAATIRLYWSTNDCVTNATAWLDGGFVTNRGAFADGTTFTNTLSGLTPNTTYYWNHSASNLTGTVWADTADTPSFKTLGAPGVDNGGGATPIGAHQATLNGTLTDGVQAFVSIHWWTNGATTTNVFDFGSIAEGSFSTNLTGLTHLTAYQYRSYATNTFGESWAPVSNFTTTADANTWDGETGDGNWGTAANWQDNTVPASGASITFPDVVNQTVSLGSNRTVGTLTFNAADAYTLSGNTLSFGDLSQQGAGSVRIESGMTVGFSYSSGTGAGTLTIAGPIGGGILDTRHGNHWLELDGTNNYARFANPTYDYSTLLYSGAVRVRGENTRTMTTASLSVRGPSTVEVASASSTPFGKGPWVLGYNASDPGADLTIATSDTNAITLGNQISYGRANTIVRMAGPGDVRLTNGVTVGNVLNCSLITAVGRTTVERDITAASQFWKGGAGVLEIAPDCTAAIQRFFFNQGTLLVNGLARPTSATYLEIYSMDSDTTLGGTGTIHYTCSLPSGATLAPGDGGPGTLTVSNMAFQAGAVYEWEIEDGLSDRCDVLNTLTLGSSATLKLSHGEGPCKVSDQFVLFNYTGADPTNPTWQFQFTGDRWGRTNAVVTVEAANNRVVLSGISVLSRGTVFTFK